MSATAIPAWGSPRVQSTCTHGLSRSLGAPRLRHTSHHVPPALNSTAASGPRAASTGQSDSPSRLAQSATKSHILISIFHLLARGEIFDRHRVAFAGFGGRRPPASVCPCASRPEASDRPLRGPPTSASTCRTRPLLAPPCHTGLAATAFIVPPAPSRRSLLQDLNGKKRPGGLSPRVPLARVPLAMRPWLRASKASQERRRRLQASSSLSSNLVALQARRCVGTGHRAFPLAEWHALNSLAIAEHSLVWLPDWAMQSVHFL